MGQKSIQQIENIKKMSRAMSIFFNVLQWLLIPVIVVVTAFIIWQPSEPLSYPGATVMFGGLEVTHAAAIPDGAMSSAGPMSSAIKLKLFSISMTGSTLNPNVKTVLFILIFFYLFFCLKILHHLRRLFGNYAVGDIFSGKSIGQIRRLGFTMLFLGIFHLAPLFLIIKNFRNFIFREDFHNIGLHIQLDGIILGCLVILIAWIMDVGRDMKEENELTV